MKPKKIVLVYTKPKYPEHRLTFDEVISTLRHLKIDFRLAERSKLDKKIFLGANLVLVVGGDGTFLRASHYAGSIPMLGVNSNIMAKVGFFMQCDRKDFREKMIKVVTGKYSIKNVARLQAAIDGKRVDECALNEFYIGPVPAYSTYNYILDINGRKEYQKSSGVLVGTGAGSNAWIKSAGGVKMPLDSNKMQFLVRELNINRLMKPKMKKGIISGKIKIISKTGGLLVADSVSKEYPLKPGSVVAVSLAKTQVRFIKM